MSADRIVEYDDEIDTVTGVRELIDHLRGSRLDALIDWRYAHTLLLEVAQLRTELAADRERIAGFERYQEEAERQFSEAATEWGEITAQRDNLVDRLLAAEAREAELRARLEEYRQTRENLRDAMRFGDGSHTIDGRWIVRKLDEIDPAAPSPQEAGQ